MKKIELINLLNDIAINDLTCGADIFDHPCTVAVRAIDKAFSDIEALRKIAPKSTGSKKVQLLTAVKYNPEW